MAAPILAWSRCAPAAARGRWTSPSRTLSDAAINSLYLAKTERVTAAGQDLDYNSPQGADLWGPDLLTHSGIGEGHSVQLDVPPGTYDVRALDRHSRYQHVTGLRLGAGGRYILELNDGGWRTK